MKLGLTSLLLLCFLVNCNGREDGAPLSACSTLTPKHKNIVPQKSRSPYFVSTGPTENNKVKVTISSQTEDLQGFVLQARSKIDPSKLINGQFTNSADTKTINCDEKIKSTLTHINPNAKRAIVTEWTPNSDVNEDVVFRATVAKTYYEFWTQLDSQPISISGGNVAPTEEKSVDPIYTNCFIKKGCFGLPAGCVEKKDCEVLLTYVRVPSGVLFSMHGQLDSLAYMAMGLSEDDRMGKDSVNECYRDGSDVIARESWNEGRVNTRTNNLPQADYSSKFTDGLSSCSWVKPYYFESNGGVFDLENSYYHVLLATGEVKNEILQYHHIRIASVEPLNITMFENLEEENDSNTKVDGEKFEATPAVSTAAESDRDITTTSSTDHTTESNTSHAPQFSINIFYVILTLLLASKGHALATLI